MSIEQQNKTVIVSEKGFQAVGLKWEGTFAEAAAGHIRKVHEEMHRRLKEIQHVVDPDTLQGLSYHASPDGTGFTHYAVVKVESVAEVPEGMVSITVPDLMYAQCEHYKGQSIDQSYNNIYAWIANQGYEHNNVDDLTHFEKYPMKQDPYDESPEFSILIPVVKK
ncbi:GyrI-like domain-containing protein [Alkalihalobacillus sp. AL-G]|uniref:GyrI-like domain-containing protein n=1 Tax=Alkalihalobacillus sp. AL-G TaxID=2926399 RepID=UPI002729A9C5|nr:GyrI-like domain-containing protein [Alkalihalobacillus sp. AL-G]WLD93065.1 GyrI-like domain-containing protein [Alkalihalobacillus sp. AL-G]